MKKKPTLKSLKNKAWKIFSEWIRRRDADVGGTTRCFTCDRPIHWKYEAQAGHAIGGRHHAVLFDPDICRPQCVRCNIMLRGNYPEFAARLIKENGLTWFEGKLAGSRVILKYARSDIEDLIATFKRKLGELNGQT